MGELILTAIALALCAVYWWPGPQLRRWRGSVKPSAQFSPPAAMPVLARSDALEPPAELSELRGSELPPIGSELVYVTKEELARSLALVVIIDDDDRRLSQDIISRAAGMSKERAGQLVREMRGLPDPEPSPGDVLRVRDQAGERLIPR